MVGREGQRVTALALGPLNVRTGISNHQAYSTVDVSSKSINGGVGDGYRTSESVQDMTKLSDTAVRRRGGRHEANWRRRLRRTYSDVSFAGNGGPMSVWQNVP